MTNNLEAENAEFAAKKWVWVADPTVGFIKGFVVSEDGDKYTVNCGDEVGIIVMRRRSIMGGYVCCSKETVEN